MKVVIAIDSFKGCLSSADAAAAAGKAFSENDEIVALPVSDGGEGLCASLHSVIGGRLCTAHVHDPLGREIEAQYLLKDDLAVIESAAASGLSLMHPSEYDVLNASSYGTGELIVSALAEGARTVYVGFGGTGTNDGGAGMLRAVLNSGVNLDGVIFKGLCDVSAVFCGPSGASAVFGPQKGARPQDIPVLDERLGKLACEFKPVLGRDVLTKKGAGAAGGMAGALWAILGGELAPGAECVLELLGFRDALEGADLVITGEGRVDLQTFSGKLPFIVAEEVAGYNRASTKRAKVLALAGSVMLPDDFNVSEFFDALIVINPEGTPIAEALDPSFASARMSSCVASYLSCLQR